MAHLCVLICRVDDAGQPDCLTELHRLDLPAVEAQTLQPETTLDQLEGTALACGQEVMRQLVGYQWQAVDQQLTAAQQRLFPPGDGDR